MVKEIQSLEEFNNTISNGVTVIDFYADWCGPCKAIAPKVAEFEQKYGGAKFFKVNVDDVQAVAEKCAINAMPTFHIYRDGTKIDELVGANAASLENKIKASL